MRDDLDRARAALWAIPCPADRESWWPIVGSALAEGVGEDEVLRWCEAGPNFDRAGAQSAIRSLARRPGSGRGGSLFAMARDAGWRDDAPPRINGHAQPHQRPQAARKASDRVRPQRLDFARLWADSEPATSAHPYIARRLGLPDGLRVVPAGSALTVNRQSVAGWLAVPLYDGGELASLQFIGPDGGKLTAPGPMRGWFTVGGSVAPGATVYVCEGIGQAWAAHQATKSPAVVAFGLGRMKATAQALAEQGARVVLVADVGTEAKIEAAAKEIGCAWIAPPADLGKNGDLSDLHQRDGLPAVAELLAQARGAPQDAPPTDEPHELDLAALAARDPQPPAFIVPDWLPAGEVTLLAAHGGTGKSATALHLAVCLRTGRDFHGLPVEVRGVDFVSFEDSEPVIHWRLHRICRALGVDFASLAGGLRVFDGTRSLSAWFARGEHGAYGPTAAFHGMAERIGGPGRVVIVDGSSDAFAGNEIDRAQVKAFIRMLRRLIADDGALLLLAHVDKPAARSPGDALGFSGSTGWHNGVRCRWFMFRETDEAGAEGENVVVEVRKSNYGSTGHRMVLRFDQDAHVFRRADNAPARGRPFQRADEADAILDAIRAAWAAGDPIPAAQSGQRTAHAVCEAREDFPASLKGRDGRRRFYRALEQLRAAGKVAVMEWRKPNRHVVEVLNVRE